MRTIEPMKYWAAWALCGAALGCGAATEDEGLGEPRSQSRALHCWDGSTDPTCVWKANWSPLRGANNTDIAGGHFKSPAVCVSLWEQEPGQTRTGWLATSVDQNNKYEVLAFNGNVGPNRSLSWGVYGASKRWTSRPTCASREPTVWTENGVNTPVGGFLIAGKVLGNTTPPSNDANNDKIFASAGKFAPWNPGVDWKNPTFVTAFEEVDPAHRSYATGGLPALGSKVEQGGFGAPAAVLVFMGTDQKTIYAHTHALPYTNASGATNGAWSQRLTGPALPCSNNVCWKVEGTPSITREVVTFHIVVHATRGSAHRLYETYFYSDGSGGRFSKFDGSPSPIWTQLVVPGVNENSAWLDGDPWITSDPSTGNTLYFRKNATIFQTSFTGATFTDSPQPVHAEVDQAFGSAPAAMGGIGFDNGSHVALGVGTDKVLYHIDSDGNILP